VLNNVKGLPVTRCWLFSIRVGI